MKLRSLLLGGAVGAGVSYLFDPDLGRGRRARLRDQLSARVRDVRADAERKRRHATNVAEGAVHEMKDAATSAFRSSGFDQADDQVLADRVKSEVLGDVDIPKDRISVNVEDGIVVLRGQLDSQSQIDDVLERVSAVKGVRALDNMLRVHGQPAPNKEPALEASGRAERSATTLGEAIE